MFQNYLKIAFRNLVKHRAYSLLNSLGLGLTVACCLLIFLLVQFQSGFDRFHPNLDRIGRVVTELHLDNVRYNNGVPYPMSEALRREFSMIQKVGIVDCYQDILVTVPGEDGAPPAKFKEENGVGYAEPDVFEILHFPLLKGNLAAFSAPNTALITAKTAERYFGTTEAIGRSIQVFDKREFRIVGVLQNMPDNTDCGREIFCSWATLQNGPEHKEITSWGSIRGNTRCYVLLEKGRSLAELAAALPAFSAKFPHPIRKELFGYKVYSLPALHFDTRYDGAFDKRNLWALGFIGLFLLITACVNFVNMATAQSLVRLREVGVRKALGSTKAQLFGQFMFETALLVAFSFLLGILLARDAMPYLNDWTGEHLEFGGLLRPEALLFSLALAVLLVLLAGIYPGIVMARFQPVQSLKGEISVRHAGGFSLRRGLVTTQFAISQLLIIAAVVVTLQMRYALDSDWGFQRESIVTVPVPDISKMDVLKQQFSHNPAIRSLSFCSAAPATERGNQTIFTYENRGEPEKWAVHFSWSDENYLSTFGLQLLAGHNFDAADTRPECLVNEAFVHNLNAGTAADVVGTRIRIEDNEIRIAGVLRDFHSGSFREKIPPMMIQQNTEGYTLCALRLEKGNPDAALKYIESRWNALFPKDYYECRFLDEQLARFYEAEIRTLRLVNLFTGIAILIGCLGLFGLTAFLIRRKSKEIGVRKILGASIAGILWLFGKEYAKLIAIALLIAAPLGWWAMNQWLSDFAYRISLHWWMFAGAGAVAVAVAVLTVGIQSVKAALVNPVQSLKSE